MTDLAVADAWWRREDPTRTLRFDLAGFPSCGTAIGRLDLARVPLQRGADFYAPFSGRFGAIANDLFNPPFVFANRFKKYLVYYDGPVEQPDICGTAAGQPGSGPSFAIVYIRACQADPVGEGALWAHVAVHELVHALGVVPPGAPNACAGSAGHVCDSDHDLMFPSTSGDPLESLVLDVGRNDYYGHAGAWFDLQDSGWLARLDVPSHPLTVTTEGPGTGRVDSDLPGIECPPACGIPWEVGSIVTLTATPAAGSRFRGWSGACSGVGPCRLQVSAPVSVTARFGPATFLVTVRRTGQGRVTSRPAGVSCGSRCTAPFRAGTAVRLTARAAPGWRFAAWGGACRGRGACIVRASADRTVRAAFRR